MNLLTSSRMRSELELELEPSRLHARAAGGPAGQIVCQCCRVSWSLVVACHQIYASAPPPEGTFHGASPSRAHDVSSPEGTFHGASPSRAHDVSSPRAHSLELRHRGPTMCHPVALQYKPVVPTRHP